jgi:glycosyltransferase involved in cell wall biosynthesis
MGANADRPRVAHVLISLAHGGLERCVVEWVAARQTLAPDETRVICLDEAGPLAGELGEGACVVLGAKRSRWPWDRQAVRRLREQLSTWGVDVVHSHNVAAQQYAGLAARGICRHVHTEHGSNLYLGGIANRIRLHLLKATTDAWVAVSQHTQSAIAAGSGVACRCIPNGVSEVPVGLARAVARERLGIAQANGPVFGVVGRLSHEKGVDRLIAAFVDDRLAGSSLVVVGDGPERAPLERAASSLAGHIDFCGVRDDARACLSAFDVLVIPSRSEGLPMVLLEAMAEGVAVVVSDAGQCAAVVADGCGGLLPEETAAWPAVLTRLGDAAMTGSLAAQVSCARERVVAQYAVQRTVMAYEQVYEEVLSCSHL